MKSIYSHTCPDEGNRSETQTIKRLGWIRNAIDYRDQVTVNLNLWALSQPICRVVEWDIVYNPCSFYRYAPLPPRRLEETRLFLLNYSWNRFGRNACHE